MLSTRNEKIEAVDVDLEAGNGSDRGKEEVGVIVEKISLHDDTLEVSRVSLSVQVGAHADKLAAQDELNNMLVFLAAARMHQSRPIVGTLVTMIFFLLSAAAITDAMRRIFMCHDNADCHEKIVPEFVGGVIAMIFALCACATTCNNRPEDELDTLKNLLNREQLQRVIELAEKHDIRIDQDHRMHVVEQRFRGRLTYINCQHNPVDRLFKNRLLQSAKMTDERSPLLPLSSRAPA